MNNYPSIINESECRLSHKLRMDWIYDWSNPGTSESTFIRSVLQQGRFDDTLKIAAHFGIARVEDELSRMSADYYGLSALNKAQGIMRRIKQGYRLALESKRGI